MAEVVIVAAGRTAIGNFNGSLAKTPAADLGAHVIKHLLDKTGVAPAQVDEVIMGHILTAGQGQNTARQAAIKAGLPVEVPAMAINKLCGSGLKATHLAAQAILCGDADIVVAGGQESMTRAAHVMLGGRDGVKMGEIKLYDSMLQDGLHDAFQGYHMGITAENIAEKYGISREEQDHFSVASQNKAEAAQKAGKFADEIIPLSLPQRKGDPVIFDRDEFIRQGATYDALAKLKPAFKKDGTVTAGNASGINDGAAAVIMMSAKKAQELGLQPLAVVKAYASGGVDPSIMGMGPVPATRACLKKAGWQLSDLDLIEANEAFAAQSLGVSRELEWDMSKVNVNGGAIALGHPLGCSGARITVTLLNAMEQSDTEIGLATMCIGLGQGIATIIERV